MLKGSFVALITPFTKDEEIDYPRLKKLIEWHIESGTDGLVILGTTGESPTITFEEQKSILTFVVKQVKGRIHVMVGAGSNDTRTSIIKCEAFEALGADSLLVITPYYNKTNDSGAIKHFEMIADQVHIPIFIYHVPSRTGYQLPISVIEKLSHHPNIVGIKEASGNISYAMSLSSVLSENFIMFCGNDDIVVPMMSIGAVGVISVWANICPVEVKALVDNFANNSELSLKIQQKYLNLIHTLSIETNPIPVKFALKSLAKDNGIYRLPLDEPSEENKKLIKQSLKEVGLL
ncbi:4-hydroxy-tetrahydrodipicolinate synthase [Lactovum miscens]|uniref:4-hydroxy-tetrahydrodipicolinate synthase n=1 Tax=Lactovum miscens TaxID=190387 RepID=A0A841C3B5_9LACT|nr:4-hydroxy-tetrahydrodipicolinate synthase [Lactovum miscens]MBB5887323.1 4-hydroxy-tetrahydrodipicolinate synthase [Lactovum miscens]